MVGEVAAEVVMAVEDEPEVSPEVEVTPTFEVVAEVIMLLKPWCWWAW